MTQHGLEAGEKRECKLPGHSRYTWESTLAMFAPPRVIERCLIISGFGFAVRETTVGQNRYLCTPIESQARYYALSALQLLIPAHGLHGSYGTTLAFPLQHERAGNTRLRTDFRKAEYCSYTTRSEYLGDGITPRAIERS
jgi:hypothetical protein